MTSEAVRLRALRKYAVLDTPPEPNFDRITGLAASIFEKPYCTLALADVHRHWFKSHHGIDATQMPRSKSFCDQTLREDNVFIVPDASKDSRFSDAPVVAGPPHMRFYAGAPLITPGGTRIGTLCVLDSKPNAEMTDARASILTGLAETAVELLEARSRQIELARCTEEIAHMANHDPLTGLANRRMFAEFIDDARHTRGLNCGAVLYLDLDRFKAVNDTFGHTTGDSLLQQVAVRLRMCVETADRLARLGGDEFAVVRMGPQTGGALINFAERLISEVSRPYLIEGETVEVGVSIGIAIGTSAIAEADYLLREADQALYRAKRRGRGRFELCDRAPPFDGPEHSGRLDRVEVCQ